MKCGDCELYVPLMLTKVRGTCIRGSLTGRCESMVYEDEEGCHWVLQSRNHKEKQELRGKWDKLRKRGAG